MTKRTINYFSTFTGIGGFERALEEAIWLANEASGANKAQPAAKLSSFVGSASATTEASGATDALESHCVGFSEIDKFATSVYRRHFIGSENYGDITKIKENDLPDFNLLVGGYPCQAYSSIGQRKGLSDPRAQLFFDLARIIKAKQPKVFVLENVPAHLSADKGQAFATILNTLSELGYFVEWQVLNSNDFGSIQTRKRVIIVGLLGKQPSEPLFPIQPTCCPYFDEAGIVSYAKSRDQVALKDTVNTITASYRGVGGYNEPCVLDGGKIRRFTPLECERLQGFPDNWTAYGIKGEKISNSQRYHQLGNAVNVHMLRAVFNELLKNTSYREALTSN